MSGKRGGSLVRRKRAGFPVVAHTLLVRDGRLFMLRRARTGFMDGYYGPPGGHQRHGESVTEAARRECLEESGATPHDLQPRCVLPYISGRHQGLNFVFESHDFAGAPAIGEPELFDDCCWASPADLPAKIPPWLAEVFAMTGGHWYRELCWS